MIVTDYTLADSDQVNATDISPAGQVVTIAGTRAGPIDAGKKRRDGTPKRRLDVLLDGYTLPWRPSKGMIRVLRDAWGPDSALWVGRSLEIYQEPSISFGGAQVGGIRIRAMQHLPYPAPWRCRVKESRGKTVTYEIAELPAEDAPPPPSESIHDVMARLELSQAEVDAWLVSRGRPPTDDLDDGKLQALADHLSDHPDAVPRAAASGGPEN